jgi:hypothetical protein
MVSYRRKDKEGLRKSNGDSSKIVLFKRGLGTHEIYEVYRAGSAWAGVILRL